jgi:RNA polymerase sigma factor (sigma-70 family)
MVTAAADGDSAAWNALVLRFSGLVWAVTRAHRLPSADAADVFQTTWLRLAEHIRRLDNPAGVGAWLATAARRECLQVIRASARLIPTSDMTRLESMPASDTTPEEAFLRAEREQQEKERAQALWNALERLPGRCRDLLRILMTTPAPSYAEISAALDLPIGSIGPTRARCLRKLREELA